MKKSVSVTLSVLLVVIVAAAAYWGGTRWGLPFNRGSQVADPSTLLPFLKHEKAGVRRNTVELIRNINVKDADCIAALKKLALVDDDPSVRFSALSTVTSLEGDQAVGFLLEALKSDHSRISTQAAQQLGRLKNREAFEPVRRLTEEEFEKLQSGAAAGPKRPARLPGDLRTLVNTLANIDAEKSLPYVLKALRSAPDDYTLQSALTRAATRENVDQLLEFAKSLPPAPPSDSGSKPRDTGAGHVTVIRALNKVRSSKAVPYLKAQLDSPSAVVQGEAARVLAETAGSAAFDALAGHFKTAAASAEKLGSGEAAMNLMRPWMDALRSAADRRACALFLNVAGTSRHEAVRIHSARALRVLVDPNEGPAIYRLWQSTGDSKLKRMLKLVLEHGRGYGYIWDEAKSDFKKAPEPRQVLKPPPPAK